jgi:hypothetical protein
MNPVGLTRAEEEKEHPAPTSHQPQAPAGTAQCVATLLPDGRMCGAEARWLVVWTDPEAPKTPACTDCAKRFRAMAQSHGSNIGVEPIS